jgi:hypothetical protein
MTCPSRYAYVPHLRTFACVDVDPQTDDTLPFRNNILDEYAMLLATPPLGLGLSNQAAERLAQMSMAARFPPP